MAGDTFPTWASRSEASRPRTQPRPFVSGLRSACARLVCTRVHTHTHVCAHVLVLEGRKAIAISSRFLSQGTGQSNGAMNPILGAPWLVLTPEGRLACSPSQKAVDPDRSGPGCRTPGRCRGGSGQTLGRRGGRRCFPLFAQAGTFLPEARSTSSSSPSSSVR